jgi:shikimate kinase
LSDDPADTLQRLYAERRPLYEELADVVVDVDGITPDEAVERILAALK